MEQNYRFEEMYYDDNCDYQVRYTYFGNWDAAANYMQLKIEEYMCLDCYYECYITHLVGDCAQVAQYVQKVYLK